MPQSDSASNEANKQPPHFNAPPTLDELKKHWQSLEQLWKEIIQHWPIATSKSTNTWQNRMRRISLRLVDMVGSKGYDKTFLEASSQARYKIESARRALVEAGQYSDEIFEKLNEQARSTRESARRSRSLAIADLHSKFVDSLLKSQWSIQEALEQFTLELDTLPTLDELQKDKEFLRNLLREITRDWLTATSKEIDSWQSQLFPISVNLSCLIVTKDPNKTFLGSTHGVWRNIELARGALVKASHTYDVSPIHTNRLLDQLENSQKYIEEALKHFNLRAR